ncbi:unnamed protein product [Brassicogethes aeneus]|uniref:CUB domain-containing protein n=1 Tax=Brassicogethes aeneus TaxID=1431903 RepID=A0A9P0ANI5_BRAAE|nr:unnamed protein product [Brassicogethes aeneus]
MSDDVSVQSHVPSSGLICWAAVAALLRVRRVTFIIQRMDQEGPTIDFVISTTMGEKLSGEFQGHQYPDCGPHIFTSQLKSNEVSLNWTFQASVDYTRPNITFQLKYRYDKYTYQILYTYPIMEDCQLYLREEEAEFGHRDIPHTSDCQVWFPIRESGHGLVIELLKLNVPCSKGYIHFSGLNVTQHQHFRTHKQTQICGKLEELPDSDRHIYFPSSPMSPFMQVHGSPIFSLNYHLVDYCYNVTFVAKNGSFELKPSGELQCTFKIYLPYGNRVAMNLQIGDSTSTGSPETGSSFQDNKNSDSLCNGLLTQLHDGGNTWSHCTIAGDAERQIEMVSRENKVVLKVSVRSGSGGALGLRMTYRAEPVESIVGMCGFGWVALRQFCVSAPEGPRLPWAQAEMECTRRGGHLASIRNQHDQAVVDSLLLNRLVKIYVYLRLF